MTAAPPNTSRLRLRLVCFLVFLICCYIFYARVPQNLRIANFYAEDGTILMAPLVTKGFLSTVFTPFNGYFVVGLYLLTGIARLVDIVFFSHLFVALPKSMALVSYGFLALCVSLPLWLLRHLARWEVLTVLAFAGALMPLTWDDAIVGTIGNLKFAFVYIALIVVIRRITFPSSGREKIVLYSIFLLCAYTNVTVYLLTPFLAWPLLTDWFSRNNLRDTIRTHSPLLREIAALGVLLLPQIVMIAVKGVPKLPGYLDAPFEWNKGIAILLSRPLLFSFFGGWFEQLTDLSTLILVVLLFVWVWDFNTGIRLFCSSLALGLALAMTILFVSNRPGVSHFFTNPYAGGGPGQFFYAQNWMTQLAVFFTLASMFSRWSLTRLRAWSGLLAAILLVASPLAHIWDVRKEKRDRETSIKAVLERTCPAIADPNTPVTLVVYPISTAVISLTVPASTACPPSKK